VVTDHPPPGGAALRGVMPFLIELAAVRAPDGVVAQRGRVGDVAPVAPRPPMRSPRRPDGSSAVDDRIEVTAGEAWSPPPDRHAGAAR
jgi:hypothetical protein